MQSKILLLFNLPILVVSAFPTFLPPNAPNEVSHAPSRGAVQQRSPGSITFNATTSSVSALDTLPTGTDDSSEKSTVIMSTSTATATGSRDFLVTLPSLALDLSLHIPDPPQSVQSYLWHLALLLPSLIHLLWATMFFWPTQSWTPRWTQRVVGRSPAIRNSVEGQTEVGVGEKKRHGWGNSRRRRQGKRRSALRTRRRQRLDLTYANLQSFISQASSMTDQGSYSTS